MSESRGETLSMLGGLFSRLSSVDGDAVLTRRGKFLQRAVEKPERSAEVLFSDVMIGGGELDEGLQELAPRPG